MASSLLALTLRHTPKKKCVRPSRVSPTKVFGAVGDAALPGSVLDTRAKGVHFATIFWLASETTGLQSS